VKPLSYNPPPLRDDFIEIAISHCGICGSDIHTIDSGWGPTNYPVIPGHEIVGLVVAKGKAVQHLEVGQRVGVGAQCGACLNRNGHDECVECAAGYANHCRTNQLIWTYGCKYPDGQVSQGGYANRVRCQGDLAFVIPDSISSAHAAPLMCAGVTVFAPLVRWVTRPKMRVAIIGIGGLGHLGVLFARKLHNGSCHVTAVSHNSKKREEALAMGADSFLDTSDENALKAAFRSFDVVIATANGKGQDWENWMSTVALHGTFCVVGLPEDKIAFNVFSLTTGEINFTGSGIGSPDEIRHMLKFAAEHNVRPIIENLPMDQANQGLKRVREGTVRFRVVLENPPQ